MNAMNAMNASPLVPVARTAISIRPATIGDLSFIDSLQKMHSKQVGWMPSKQLEGKIKAGHVIVAEEMQNDECRMQNEDEKDDSSSSFCALHSDFCVGHPLGYCIGHDQYFKRDDVGIIYQMNVVPAKQRGLIGATLVKAMFERAAYGCRLFCCWCAQDIEANYFWESLGFIPLAFRAGSREKDRVHIFWQRRIREGDTTTPYWFPAQTSAGSIREDRLVLPIPPGTSWKDVMPRVLPKEKPLLSDETKKAVTQPAHPKMPTPPKRRFVQFGPPPSMDAQPAETVIVNAKPKRPAREKKPKLKNDPQHVAAARELRDRYLERFNQAGAGAGAGATGNALPVGRYDVAVALPAPSSQPTKALPVAA